MNRRISLLFSLALLSLSGVRAHACPDFIARLQTTKLPRDVGTLCNLYDRYQNALASLQKSGLNSSETGQIATALGPRFINMPDWLSMAPAQNFSPWYVYKPAPDTWLGWTMGLRYYEANLLHPNLEKKSFQPLTLDLLYALQREAVAYPKSKTAAAATSLNDRHFGLFYRLKDALEDFQVNTIVNTRYPDQDGNLLKAGVIAANADPALPGTKIYGERKFIQFDLKGERVTRECGATIYPTPAEVPSLLQGWLAELNQNFARWNEGRGGADPIVVAARAQRWLVSIHAFNDGNGRVSRFMMDLVLQSFGLPAPLLANMDYDYLSSESDWAHSVGRGLAAALDEYEACAKNPRLLKCQVVGRQPGPNLQIVK